MTEFGAVRSTARVSILMYHQVGRFAPMREHRANYCDHRRFARQMAFLHSGGFQVLGLDAALCCLAGQRSTPPRAVVLTFDDAYAGFLDYAAPVLAQYKFPATVYAISDWLGEPMRWRVPDPNRECPRLMSSNELRSLQQSGITIGSHGCTHQRLAELPLDQQRAELSASRARLEDRLGTSVRHLCYPFGSFSHETVAVAAESGYCSATTCLRGAATPADHPLVLPRKAISYGDNLLGFGWKLLVKHAAKPALRDWRAQRSRLPDPFPTLPCGEQS